MTTAQDQASDMTSEEEVLVKAYEKMRDKMIKKHDQVLKAAAFSFACLLVSSLVALIQGGLSGVAEHSIMLTMFAISALAFGYDIQYSKRSMFLIHSNALLIAVRDHHPNELSNTVKRLLLVGKHIGF